MHTKEEAKRIQEKRDYEKKKKENPRNVQRTQPGASNSAYSNPAF